MIRAGHHLWRLSVGGDRNLGVCCSEDGLVLGGAPLIERCGESYVLRSHADLERLFGRAYGGAAVATRVMPGLALDPSFTWPYKPGQRGNRPRNRPADPKIS